jgi:hypothetical protein
MDQIVLWTMHGWLCTKIIEVVKNTLNVRLFFTLAVLSLNKLGLVFCMAIQLKG